MDHLQYGHQQYQQGSAHMTVLINILGSSGTARSILSRALADEVSGLGLTAQIVGTGSGKMQSLADAGSYLGQVDLVVGDGLLLDAPGLALLNAAASEIFFLNVWIESPNLNDAALRETYRQDQPMLSVTGSTESCVANIMNFLGQMPTKDALTELLSLAGPENSAGQNQHGQPSAHQHSPDEEAEKKEAQHRADRRAYDKMLSRQ